jgi:enediyne biosynthesis protein E4
MILRPEHGPQTHWISFQLEGESGNRLALNARFRATAGDLVQLGEVLNGGSYLSQNDLRIHFGLAALSRGPGRDALAGREEGKSHRSRRGQVLRYA